MTRQASRGRADLLGVLGGTFDPVHRGHLAVARHVRGRLRLDRFVLMPAAGPPHKIGVAVTGATHRLAMLERATARARWLEVSKLELDRGGVSFTIDTLRRLRERRPGTTPVFVMGMDSLVELDTWKDYRTLVREFDLVVVDRPGCRPRSARLPAAVVEAIVDLPAGIRLERARGGPPLGTGGRIFVLPMPPVPISSSEIRRLAARGGRLDDLVPCSVARYIRSHGLYRKEVTS